MLNRDWWYGLPTWGKWFTLPILMLYIIFLGFVVLPALYIWGGIKRLYEEVL
jgi:hypothetical protein